MNSKKSTRRSAKHPAIVIGGLAGSGKSTIANALAKIFGLRHVSAGDAFRALAKKRGMELLEFGRYSDQHLKINRDLDWWLVREAKKGNVIVDGRSTAYLTKKAGIPALRIFLATSPKVSAKRIAVRDGTTPKKALAYSRLREKEIAARLKKLYGLDTSDASNYDVTVQTDGFTPKEVVGLVAQLVRYARN